MNKQDQFRERHAIRARNFLESNVKHLKDLNASLISLLSTSIVQ